MQLVVDFNNESSIKGFRWFLINSLELSNYCFDLILDILLVVDPKG